MDTNYLYLRSCGCISLRTAVIITGIISTVVGLLYYLSELAFTLAIIQVIIPSALNFSIIVTLLLYEYPADLNIIFGIYLLYGTIKDTPKKSGFILSWLLLKGLSIGLSIFNLFMKSVMQNIYSSIVIMDELILLSAQILTVYIVYSYYRILPKPLYQFN